MFKHFTVIAMILTFALAGCGAPTPQPAAPKEITVSAAASLKDVLGELQQNYQKQHPEVKININYGASGMLQQQIEQGAPVDLFISAAEKPVNDLAAKKLIKADSRINLLMNKLVLITNKDSAVTVSSFADLASDRFKKIGVGEPEAVPAGQYAREVLQRLGAWEKVSAKAVYAKDVRNVLTYVESGNVDAGIVYQTDAAISGKVKVLATAPEGSHQPIIYPAAVIASSKAPEAAASFLEYLRGSEAQAVFAKYGFSSVR